MIIVQIEAAERKKVVLLPKAEVGGEEEGDLSASIATSSWSRESAGGFLRDLAGDGTLDGVPGGGSGYGSRGLGVRS